MNEVIRNIKSRRSTRKYKAEQISREELEIIIDAGLHAPSAHNHQSWHLTVIQDKGFMDEMDRNAKVNANNHEDEMIRRVAGDEKRHIFYHAPTLVMVSGRKDAMMPREDCAAATQNMLLAAESLGIGGCWNGIVALALYGEAGDAIVNRLDLPEGYEPYYCVTLGYKDQAQAPVPKRRENTVTYL